MKEVSAGTQARRTAAFAIARWRAEGVAAENLLPDGGEERAFVQDLVYTAIRRHRTLEWVLRKFLKKWPKGELEALLLAGAAQILFMDDVPDYAACNETAEAARLTASRRGNTSVVNGVLRNILRRKDDLLKELSEQPLALRESYPDFLVMRWEARYGVETAEKLAKWHNQSPDIFLAYPDGRFELKAGDRVGITGAKGETAKLLKNLGLLQKQARSVMILGGSRTAFYLTRLLLASGTQVKIIERDRDICRDLCDAFPKAMVLQGDGASQEILMEEGLTEHKVAVVGPGDHGGAVIGGGFPHQDGCTGHVFLSFSNEEFDLEQTVTAGWQGIGAPANCSGGGIGSGPGPSAPRIPGRRRRPRTSCQKAPWSRSPRRSGTRTGRTA